MIRVRLARAQHPAAPIGTDVWVSPQAIEVVFPSGTGGSLLWMSGGWDMVVDDAPDAVAGKGYDMEVAEAPAVVAAMASPWGREVMTVLGHLIAALEQLDRKVSLPAAVSGHLQAARAIHARLGES